MTNRARPVPFAFTPKAIQELNIEPSTIVKRLNELVELEEKRKDALNAWLRTPKNTPEAAEAYAVLDSFEEQLSILASAIAHVWRQECL